MSSYKTKKCACGCGRVGQFHTYASDACKQRAYRNRKKAYDDTKISTVSSFYIDMFGEQDLTDIFYHLNQVKGTENVKHVTAVMEELSYLLQKQIRKARNSRKAL